MDASRYTVQNGRHGQIAPILALLSRLASFQLPARRRPEDLWNGDAELLKEWAQGNLPDALVKIAEDADGTVLGAAFAQLRPEALSQTQHGGSAEKAQGRGIAQSLVAAVEQAAVDRGARPFHNPCC